MKALVYTGTEKVEVRDVPVPTPANNQVTIKVKYCGVCGSDISIFLGKHPRAKAPLVLGHEFIGTVEAINGGSGKFKVGDRVSAYPLLSCGHCFACQTGSPHVCQTLKLIGIDIDGGMAEYVTCNEDVLFKIEEGVSDEAAAVIEPLAVIVRTLHQANFAALDTAAVMGAGPIGLLTAIMLRQCGASAIFISDIDEGRLALCQEMGFATINLAKQNMVEVVQNATGGTGVDVVFECSGAEQAALEMTKLCRIGGTICLTGVHKVPHAVNLQDVNFKEQTLVGSRVYTQREFGQAVAYATQIAPQLQKVVTHIVPLSAAQNVFGLIGNASQTTMKILVDCQN